MAQYCRFCANCQISEMSGGAFCAIKEKEIAESTAKHVNKCKHYEECQLDGYEKDFFGESKLVHRKSRKAFKGQMEMEV